MTHEYINHTGEGSGHYHPHGQHCGHNELCKMHFADECEKDPNYPEKKAAIDRAILERMREIKEARGGQSQG